MPVFSEVEICNLALGQLQRKPINSLNDASQEARTSKRFYTQSLVTLLSAIDWSFARRWLASPVLDVTVRTGWTTAVAWPDDCLRVRGVAKTVGGEPTPRYEIGGYKDGLQRQKLVYTALAAPVLVYTAYEDDPSMFEGMFVEALKWLLAVNMCIPLGKGREHLGDVRKGYTDALLNAAASELNQGERTPEAEDPLNDDAPWITARF